MDTRPFRPSTRPASAIGQGTWRIGDGDRRAAVSALRQGLDLGMTHIDTAEMYGDAEDLVGEAIAGRRQDVFLVSKVLPGNASRRGTVKACERSLAKLRTDHLDGYLLHWRTGEHPLEDTIAAFQQLQHDGKIRSWGVSNFDEADLEDAWRIDGTGLSCNQVLYHLQERGIEHAVLPWCERHGVAVVGYTPFGRWRFPGTQTAGGSVLQDIADAHCATTRQVVLAFLVRRRSLFAIPKAASPGHAAENAAAGDLRLTEADLTLIDRAFPRGPRPRELPML